MWHEWVQDPSEHRTLGTEEVRNLREARGICVNTAERRLCSPRGCSGEAIFPYTEKEFIGPGPHLRPVHADHARPPLRRTLNVMPKSQNLPMATREPISNGKTREFLLPSSSWDSHRYLCVRARPDPLPSDNYRDCD